MFVLEGLKNEGKKVSPSLTNMVAFYEKEMKENYTEINKIDEFYKRKYKDTKKVYRVGFASLNPIKLEFLEEFEWEETSNLIKESNNAFYPMFLSSGTANNQYRKIRGPSSKHLNQNNNTGSFSDFLITNKTFTKLLKTDTSPICFDTDGLKIGIKKNILEKFYEVINNISVQVQMNNTNIYLDFDSLVENETISHGEAVEFLNSLLEETGLIFNLNTDEIVANKELNKYIYLLENIFFHIEFICEINIKKRFIDKGMINFERILKEETVLTFGVPNDKKKILANNRNSKLEKDEDIPKVKIFELIILRVLSGTINKQGKAFSSGYHFDMIEKEKIKQDITLTTQIVANDKGNFFVERVFVKDRMVDEELIRKIKESSKKILNKDLSLEESKKVTTILRTSLSSVLKNLSARHLSETDKIWSQFNNKNYKGVGKSLLEGPFCHLEKRLEDMDWQKIPPFYHLRELLFILNVTGNEKIVEGVGTYIMSKDKVEEILLSENISNNDFYYVLGKILGISVRSSGNSGTLYKKSMKYKRTKDILNGISKRMESGFDEIEYKPMLSKWMGKVQESKVFVDKENSTLNDMERFSYISGILSTTKTEKTNLEEN